MLEAAASDPDGHWIWTELETRFVAGKLTDEEVATAVDHVITYVTAEREKSKHIHLRHGAEKFLTLAENKDMIHDQQMFRLFDACYGDVPSIKPFEGTSPYQASLSDRPMT